MLGVVIGVAVGGVLLFALSRGSGTKPASPTEVATTTSSRDSAAEEELLRRLEKELAAIRKMAATADGYERAVTAYDDLLPAFVASETATNRITKARTSLVERAEREAEAAARPLRADAEVMIGDGLEGPAFDRLREFPEVFGWTQVGRAIAAQTGDLDRKLGLALKELLALADEQAAAGALDKARKVLRGAIDRFDRARRSTIEAKLRDLDRESVEAAALARKRLLDDYNAALPEIKNHIGERAYPKARVRFAPLAERLAAVDAEGADKQLQPLRIMAWDLVQLARLSKAYAATADAPNPRDSKPNEYLEVAVKNRPEVGVWALARAVFGYYERTYPEALAAVEEAKQAGQDTEPIEDRLKRAASSSAEELATRAFEALRELHERKAWADLLEGIEAFLGRHGRSQVAMREAATIAAWRKEIEAAMAKKPEQKQGDDPEKEGLAKLLNATEIEWNPRTRKLKLVYKWEKPDELKDWFATSVADRMESSRSMAIDEEGWLTGSARGGFNNVVVWTNRKLAVSSRYNSRDPQISGFGLMSQGHGKRVLAGFDWIRPMLDDDGPGAYIYRFAGNPLKPANSLAKAGDPVVKPGQAVTIKATTARGKFWLYVNNRVVASGADATLKKGRVSLNSWNKTSWDVVTIEGYVDPAWLKSFLASSGKENGKDAEEEVDWEEVLDELRGDEERRGWGGRGRGRGGRGGRR